MSAHQFHRLIAGVRARRSRAGLPRAPTTLLRQEVPVVPSQPFVGPVSLPLRVLLLACVAAAFSLITLGGVVRATGSGLGCPDWPMCHGRLIPPLEFHTLLEYSHRLMAAVVGTLVLVSVTIVWRQRRHNRVLLAPVTIACVLLGVAVALGGLTVLGELPPFLVALHLGTAETILALLIMATVRAWKPAPKGRSVHLPVVRHALTAAILTLVVILSGSYMVGVGAGNVCGSWPLCGPGLLPSSTLEGMHMVHRVLSGVAGLAVMGAIHAAWRQRKQVSGSRAVAAVLGAALLGQMAAGAAIPWLDFVPFPRAFHLSGATVLWGTLIFAATINWHGENSGPLPTPFWSRGVS